MNTYLAIVSNRNDPGQIFASSFAHAMTSQSSKLGPWLDYKRGFGLATVLGRLELVRLELGPV